MSMNSRQGLHIFTHVHSTLHRPTNRLFSMLHKSATVIGNR